MMRRVHWYLLSVCFLLGLVLRIYPGLYENIFPYDQARDALVVREMVMQKNIKLLGPVSDIQGVHHGPLFYYVLAPLYAVSRWDPWLPFFFFALLNVCAISGVYAISRMFFSYSSAIVSSILFLFSYEMVSYAKWLSNPVLVIPLLPWFLFFLWNKEGREKNIFISGFLFGLLVQSELVMGFLLLFIYAVLLLRKSGVKAWTLFHCGAILGALPLIVAEIKFRGQTFLGLVRYVLSHMQSVQQQTPPPLPVYPPLEYLRMMSTLFQRNVWGFSLIFSGLLMILVLYAAFLYAKKQNNTPKILFLCGPLIASFLLFFIGKQPEKFFFVGLGLIFIILFSYVITNVFQYRYKIFIALFVFLSVATQLRMIFLQILDHRAYVQVQDGVLLRQRKEVLDAIYKEVSQDTPFTISIFETPYGIRTSWSYYFFWYQSKRHVVLPKWYGFAADGYIGDEILPRTDRPFQTHITVYEPHFDIGPEYLRMFKDYQEKYTVLVKELTVYNHTIQVRKPREFEASL